MAGPIEVDRILDKALDLAGAARQSLLDRECAGDPDLRAQVERLLSHCDEETAFLETGGPLGMSFVGRLDSADDDADLSDAVLGNYRIGHEIGRGGMSIVYQAKRIDGSFEHDVAIKVIKRGIDTSEVVARFLQERQILARIDHPSIARLHDGGVAPDGRPYFVMEHVGGLPLDRALQGFGLERRLAIFLEICEAVAEAHRHLVVHRDLKPSNILVTEDGRAKLLDFGIAKVLDETGDFGATPVTRTASQVMTPWYASPEQILGEPSTTATDIYQLGLVLYELLVDRRMFAEARGVADLSRRICHEDPIPPSRAAEQKAQRDGPGSVPIPASKLRGDLDAITLKALRKEAKLRYLSAGQLINDIERFLRGEPVTARSGSFAYRASRFISRYKAAISASLLALAAFLALGTFSVLRIADERDLARREARRAEQRESEARAATDFLAGMLRKASPHGRGESTELTVRQALNLGLEQLQSDLHDAPLVRARVLLELADLFTSLGDTRRSLELGNEAITLWQGGGGDSEADLATTLRVVGVAYRIEADYVRARQHLDRALQMRRRIFGDRHPLIAQVLADIAIVADIRGDADEAGELFERALGMLDPAGEEASLGQRAMLLCNIGIYHKNLGAERGVAGAFDKAEASLSRGLEALRARPELASFVALTLVNLGNLKYRMGHLEQSEAFFEEALEDFLPRFGDRHPNVALALSNLGRTLTALGRFDEAEAALEHALEIREEVYGDTHPSVAVVLNRLGGLRRAEGRPAAALPLLERALEIRRQVHAQGHPTVADSLRDLARCQAELGQQAQAAALLEQAAEIYDIAGRAGEADEMRSELAALGHGIAPIVDGFSP